jgi:hypothetical protein
MNNEESEWIRSRKFKIQNARDSRLKYRITGTNVPLRAHSPNAAVRLTGPREKSRKLSVVRWVGLFKLAITWDWDCGFS